MQILAKMSIDLELKKLSFFHYDAEKNDGNGNKTGLITLVKNCRIFNTD